MKLLLGVVAVALAATGGSVGAAPGAGLRGGLLVLVATFLMLFATANWS